MISGFESRESRCTCTCTSQRAAAGYALKDILPSKGMQLSPVLSFLCAASLAVATAAASPLVFTVLGDWGGKKDDPFTTPAETGVAAAMGEVAASVSSQFTVALGDNFYDTGVKDVHDPRFKETFEVLETTLLHAPCQSDPRHHREYRIS